MEKRNFVTSTRVTNTAEEQDTLIKSAADIFSDKKIEKEGSWANLFEKTARAEDEKSDSGH